MSFALLIAAVASIGAGEPEPAASTWTVGATGSFARTDDLDTDSTSIGAFVEYGAPGWFAGVSLSGTDGTSMQEDYGASAGGSGVSGAAWVGWTVDDWTLDLNASLSQQDIADEVVAGPEASPSLQGRSVNIDGETVSSSLSVGVARSFYFDSVSLTPHARAGWDRTSTDTIASLAGSRGNGLAIDNEASGVTASAGLSLTVSPASWLSLFADASGVYTTSEAANAFTLGGRTSQPRTASGSDEGAGWAEISAGVSFFAPAGVTISLTGGGTAGRDADDVFASASLSKTF